MEYISAWLIEEITANDRSIAKYEYGSRMSIPPYDATNTRAVNEYTADSNGAGSFRQVSSETTRLSISEKRGKIETITTDYGCIRFRFANTLIDQIQIQIGTDSEYARSYHLTYLSLHDQRRTIQRIEIGFENEALNKLLAEFDYHDLDVGYGFQKYVDDYGYYNGPSAIEKRTEASTLFPKLNLPYLAYDRTCKIEFAKHGTLRRISYPTGGFKVFEYEAHKGGTDYCKSCPSGGLRIKSISEYESKENMTNKIQYSYDLNGGGGILFAGNPAYTVTYGKSPNGSNFKYRYSVYDKPINNPGDYSGLVGYRKVKESFSNGGYRTYSYHDVTPATSHGKRKRIGDNNVSANWLSDPDRTVPHTTATAEYGLLKGVEDFTSNGELVSSMSYIYDNYYDVRPIKTVKAHTLFSALSDDKALEATGFIGRYQYYSRPVRLASTNSKATKYELPTQTTYTYASQYPTLVKSSTRKDAEGECLRTEIKYPFDFPKAVPLSNDWRLRSIGNLKSRHAINTPIETLTSVFREGNPDDGCIISGELNKYTVKGYLTQKMSLRGQYRKVKGFDGANDKSGEFSYSSSYQNAVEYGIEEGGGLPHSFRIGNGTTENILYGPNGLYPIAFYKNGVTLLKYIDKTSSDVRISISPYFPETQVSFSKQINGKWERFRYLLELDIPNINPDGTLPTITIPATTDSPVRDIVVAPLGTTYSTMTHVPGIGKTSETNINGVTVHYEYDKAGRLTKVLDNDLNVLQESIYSY